MNEIAKKVEPGGVQAAPPIAPPRPAATRITFVILVFNCALWGSGAAITKFALLDYEPLFLVFCRVGLAALVLTPIVLVKLWPVTIYSKKDLFWIVTLLFFDPIGFFTFEAMAVQYTSASQAGMLWALAPLLNTMAAWVILREGTTLPVIICFLVAAGGVCMLTLGGEVSGHAPNPVLGNFLELLSLCCASAFMVIVRFLGGRYSALFLVWVQCVGATVVLLPLVLFGVAELPVQIHLVPTAALVFLALGITLGAQSIACYTTARIPIVRSAAFANTIPIFGLLFGIVLLGESLRPIQWAACAVVLGAVLVSQYFQIHRKPREKEDEASA